MPGHNYPLAPWSSRDHSRSRSVPVTGAASNLTSRPVRGSLVTKLPPSSSSTWRLTACQPSLLLPEAGPIMAESGQQTPPVLSKQQNRRRNMSGYFEIIDAPDGGFRTRLRGPSGELLAVSETFPTKRQAAAGIGLIREVAGTGLIRDMSSGHR